MNKKDQPSQSDLVLDATSLVFAQGNKRTAAPVTENAKDAFRTTIREYDNLDTNELATVLLMHLIVLGRRLSENAKRA